jgi:hypothetical protein
MFVQCLCPQLACRGEGTWGRWGDMLWVEGAREEGRGMPVPLNGVQEGAGVLPEWRGQGEGGGVRVQSCSCMWRGRCMGEVGWHIVGGGG